MTIDREKIFRGNTINLRESIAFYERQIIEHQEKLADAKAKLAKGEANIAALTPEEIIKRLKKPEYERVYAILSKLVKNVGNVWELSQLISIELNATDLDAYYDKLINSDKFNLGTSIINELSKFLLGGNSLKDAKSEGQRSCLDEFLFEDVTKFIDDEIEINIEATDSEEDIEEFIVYIKDGVVTDDDEGCDDHFYVFYIRESSFFWLIYDALLRDEEAVEEGCKLLKKVKMEMALEGKPVKFEEE